MRIELVLIPFLFSLVTACAANPEDLYTQEGTDPSVDELIADGSFVPEERWSTRTVLGSKINVNHERLEQKTGVLPPSSEISGVHIPIHGRRTDYENITRWFQVDGNTHIFRLFKGEHNYRRGKVEGGPSDWFETAAPSRVEAVSPTFTVEPGTWVEWEGTYTVIKPDGASNRHKACIFQLFHHGGQHWAIHLRMNENGDIYFQRRRDIDGLPRTITIGENMAGKPLGIKIRANGHDYEVYRKIYQEDEDWVLVTTGHYVQAVDNQISIRWGIYPGSAPDLGPTPDDIILFVSGVNWRVRTPPAESAR